MVVNLFDVCLYFMYKYIIEYFECMFIEGIGLQFYCLLMLCLYFFGYQGDRNLRGLLFLFFLIFEQLGKNWVLFFLESLLEFFCKAFNYYCNFLIWYESVQVIDFFQVYFGFLTECAIWSSSFRLSDLMEYRLSSIPL